MSCKESRKGSDFRRRKRRFHGNQHSSNTPEAEAHVAGKSASAKKLCVGSSSSADEGIYCNDQGYRIVDLSILSNELRNVLACCYCNGKITIQEKVIYGLSSQFTVVCDNCGTLSNFNNSPKIEGKQTSEINRRTVYAMRTVGLGLSGLRNFCSAMDLPPPVSQKTHDKYLQEIKCATAIIAEKSMHSAAVEEVAAASSSDICISGDGTWKTRGHTSRVGVCSIIGDITGKVIDVEVLSSYCKGCDIWKGPRKGTLYNDWWLTHKPHCVKNHSGSSASMEVEGMKQIFHRSKPKHGVTYGKYIGDGDTKTFSELKTNIPYAIQKIECVGHIQKRMGTRLRKLKQSNKGKKLSDGKSLSGKNRLTDKLIDKMTTFYGNAIRENKDSMVDMRKAIWCIFCHYRSSDVEPMHHFCPTGSSSWCDYQRAVTASNVNSFVHKTKIPPAVMDKIKPTFADLSSPDLLKKCLGGKTQNSNESFNSTVWKYCPKTSGSSKIVADIAVNEAVSMFNDGHKGRIHILKQLGFKLSHFSLSAATKADLVRVKAAEIKKKLSSLEARRTIRMRKKASNESFLQNEGITYEAGAF